MSKKRTTTNDNADDQPPLNRPKSEPTADSTSFTLLFADGSLIKLLPALSAKSLLLQSSLFDPDTPVPIDNQIGVSSAHTLIAFSSTTSDAIPNLTPHAYAMMLHLCDFLQMENDVIHGILTHLESPLPNEDPLSRLKACQQQISNFHIILFHHFFHLKKSKVNVSPEDIRRMVDVLVHTPPSSITYKDLNLCDSTCTFHRFTTTERQRRKDSIKNVLATTAAKRANMGSHIGLQLASTECETCCVDLMAGCPGKWYHGKAIHGNKDIDLCGQHFNAMAELLKQRYVCKEIQTITDLGGNDYGDPPEAECDFDEHMLTMLRKDKVISSFFETVTDAAACADALAALAASVENLSHELLDLAMWKAIKEGHVDVAQCLLLMGAEPRLYQMPVLKPDVDTFDYGTQDFAEELGAYLVPNGDIIVTASHAAHKRCHLTSHGWYSYEDQCDWEERNTPVDAPSTLMVATSNNDIEMMNFLMDSGCSPNMLQPSFLYGDGFDYGKMDALCQARSLSSMELLLSRGANPDHDSIRDHQYEEMFPEIRQLLHLANERVVWDRIRRVWRDDKFSGDSDDDGKDDTPDSYEWPTNLLSNDTVLMCKLLCRYGADVNYMMIDSRNQNYNWEFDAEGNLLTFWPHVVATQPADIAWCRELLTQQNANANWPVGILLRGPDSSLLAACGVTVLLIAVMNNNMDLARLLLQEGANPNQYEIPDWSSDADEFPDSILIEERKCVGSFAGGYCKQLACPLSVALTTGNVQMIQLLREHGATAETQIEARTYWSLPGNRHPFFEE